MVVGMLAMGDGEVVLEGHGGEEPVLLDALEEGSHGWNLLPP